MYTRSVVVVVAAASVFVADAADGVVVDAVDGTEFAVLGTSLFVLILQTLMNGMLRKDMKCPVTHHVRHSFLIQKIM